jgi:hypothetical protein
MSNSKPLSEYKSNTGNGTWFMLTHMAEKATTRPLMEAYAFFFRELCKRMEGCDCGGHCTEMLERRKPENYFHLKDENGIPDGCLRHVWECHNEVNARLGKPQYPYELVKPLWRSEEPPKPCTRNSTPVETEKDSLRNKSASLTSKKISISRRDNHPSRFQMIVIDEQ